MTFEEVWNELKSKDTTGTFAKAEELSLVSVEAIEYAFNSGYVEAKAEFERPQGEWIDYSDEGYIECPFCGQATTCEDNIDELHYCWNCGAHLKNGSGAIQKPNCVTCDHFGKCEGCEKRDEE